MLRYLIGDVNIGESHPEPPPAPTEVLPSPSDAAPPVVEAAAPAEETPTIPALVEETAEPVPEQAEQEAQ